MTKPYTRLDKDKAAVLLVDHQTGLLSLVRDIDPDKFKNNVLALADLAKYFKLPTILTTSFEDGPNGPLVPELKQTFPDAPFIPAPRPDQRLGQRGLRQGGQGDRAQAAHHRRRRHRGLCRLPGAGCDRSRLRCLRRHRCLRHLQRDHAPFCLAAHVGCRGAADDLVRRRL